MINRQNYIWTKAHLAYLREVMQLGKNSVGRYWSYLRHVLLWADEASLAQAHKLRPTLPDHLIAIGTGDGLAPRAATTQKKIVQNAKRLFTWAKMTYAREFREMPMAWIETLRPPRSVIVSPGEHVFVSLDEVRQITAMPIPTTDLAVWRDQAAAALLFVSGMRASALGSLPLAAVDLPSRTIRQWPSLGVRTKNSKSATTYLLELPELLAVIEKWDSFVREQLPPEAMWYSPIVVRWSDASLSAQLAGEQRHIALARRLQRLFTAAGLQPKSPHKFRHGHAVWALQHARTMADYKAVSMNLMHEDVRVTDGIYAPLLGSEVRDRISRLAGPGTLKLEADSDLERLLRGLSRGQVAQALHILASELAS
ncbi:MAG: tyrosine-type recombinase/integrase [Anaerolineales bacterium]|nr:tyrosine-type recombinase/integrase [Anaerolineales bacterium]